MRRVAVVGLLFAAACGTPPASREARTTTAWAEPSRGGQTGKASWYGKHHQGRKTASGERFDKNALTAAHRNLPFGTRVRVTNLDSGRSVTVRINDRGPFGGNGRIIDLSEAAARRLGMIASGVVRVRVEVVSRPE